MTFSKASDISALGLPQAGFAPETLGVFRFAWTAGVAALDLPPETRALLGLSAAEVVDARAAFARLHPLDRPRAEATRDALRAGQPIEFEGRLICADGTFRWMLLRAGPRTDARGRLARLEGVAIDIDARKRAEGARLREAQFLDVQDSSQDGFMVFEAVRDMAGAIADFRWSFVNPAGAAIIGRTVEELAGAQMLELLPGNRTSGLFDAYVQVVETGAPLTREVTYRHDDLDIHFRLTAARVGDGFAVSFADLTQRRRAEEMLHASEREWRAVLDSIPQKVWTALPGGLCDFFNLRWYQYTGARPGETDGVGWRSFIHPDDRDRALAAWNEAEASGTRFQAEYRIRTAEGGYRWLLARALPYHDDDGRVLRWFGTYTDIHDFKTAESELHVTEERLALTLAAASGIGVWDFDVPNDRVTAPGPFARLFGLDPAAAAAGRSLGDFLAAVHPADRPGVEAALAEAMRLGGPYSAEFRLAQPDGTLRWVMARGHCTLDAAGRPLRLPGALVDITDRKQAEEARELLAKELSHRIKNIFALVSSLASFTARDAPEAADYARALRARIEALGRAHDCVRPGAGAGAGTVHALLATLLAPYHLAEGRIRLEGDDAAVGPQSATALALILHEAATNSAKYGALSRPEGSVEVETAAEGADYRITWSEAGGPDVAPPSRAGFGTQMADRAAQQLGGRMARSWETGGLRLDLVLPGDQLGR